MGNLRGQKTSQNNKMSAARSKWVLKKSHLALEDAKLHLEKVICNTQSFFIRGNLKQLLF